MKVRYLVVTLDGEFVVHAVTPTKTQAKETIGRYLEEDPFFEGEYIILEAYGNI